ncbi:MAG TPA: hypothetical protein VIN07_06515 [Flavipsychrobacter sp.]
MIQVISQPDCVSAWQDAAQLIVNMGAQHNLLVEITDPCNFNSMTNWIKRKNPRAIDPEFSNTKHVINTIFPYGLAEHCPNRNVLYNTYRRIYLNSNNKGWGTYFQRLISFNKHFIGSGTNQLEDAISALGRSNRQRNFIVFHLSARHLESNVRPIGAPCWHFGQLIEEQNGILSLNAVYRSQDYFEKAFGNYLGLAKLLEFICNESGKAPGTLTIHAMYAFNNSTTQNLKDLIQR